MTMIAPPMATASITKSLAATMSALSKPSTALVTLTEIGATTPPIVYFLSLVIAGFGIPISEDVLCIFAGTLLPKLSTAAHKTKLILALYFGVVISDMITFSIGRMMRVGLLEPFRRRMNLGTSATTAGSSDENTPQQGKKKLGKRERAMAKLEKSGDWVGFVVRLSVGVRPAMMVLAGFSGKVSYAKYLLGTAVGAIISLSVQLLFGYSMSRHNPATILANISTFLLVAPLSIASVAGMLYLRRRHLSNKTAAAAEESAEISKELEETATTIDAATSEIPPTPSKPADAENVEKSPVL